MIVATAVAAAAGGIDSLDYRASVVANASTGHFAPYMLGSWNYGKITGKAGVWHDGFVSLSDSLNSRWRWNAGFEYLLGYGSATEYSRYSGDEWTTVPLRQAPARVQQLWAELRYRSGYLLAGMRQRESRIVDGHLSSGDLVRSNNARPIPGIAIGFVDFQNIPLTGGWVQIDGEIMYGRFTDNGFEEKRFNHYTGIFDRDLLYTYKRCYFRTRPDKPLSVTVGMQAAGVFGGSSQLYRRGQIVSEEHRGFRIKDIFEMFFPRQDNGEHFYIGNSLGSWDFKAQYSFKNGNRLKAYFQWPWEDGSGLGRQNGWDGLWGVQFDFAHCTVVSSVLVEYLDFTNQSGPMHWAPGDSPGTDINQSITGADSYYNNYYYGAYANYGMSIGTPFLMSPLYNLNGYPEYLHNRARGFHAAVAGSAGNISYRAMASYQVAGGSGWNPAPRKLHDTSAMLEATWHPAPRLRGLEVKAALAFDAGTLRGNNFGTMISVSYSGSLNFRKK